MLRRQEISWLDRGSLWEALRMNKPHYWRVMSLPDYMMCFLLTVFLGKRVCSGNSCSGNGNWITGSMCSLLTSSRAETWGSCLLLSALSSASFLASMLIEGCAAGTGLCWMQADLLWDPGQGNSPCLHWQGSVGTAGWLPAWEKHSSPLLAPHSSSAHVPTCLLRATQGCSENSGLAFGISSAPRSSSLLPGARLRSLLHLCTAWWLKHFGPLAFLPSSSFPHSCSLNTRAKPPVCSDTQLHAQPFPVPRWVLPRQQCGKGCLWGCQPPGSSGLSPWHLG